VGAVAPTHKLYPCITGAVPKDAWSLES